MNLKDRQRRRQTVRQKGRNMSHVEHRTHTMVVSERNPNRVWARGRLSWSAMMRRAREDVEWTEEERIRD